MLLFIRVDFDQTWYVAVVNITCFKRYMTTCFGYYRITYYFSYVGSSVFLSLRPLENPIINGLFVAAYIETYSNNNSSSYSLLT